MTIRIEISILLNQSPCRDKNFGKPVEPKYPAKNSPEVLCLTQRHGEKTLENVCRKLYAQIFTLQQTTCKLLLQSGPNTRMTKSVGCHSCRTELKKPPVASRDNFHNLHLKNIFRKTVPYIW